MIGEKIPTMSFKFLIILYISVPWIVNAATTYDQSQTGELNVQVDLKDIQIIALMKSGKEEYVDYDYAYDYSEMTIKPQNGTTPKPLNVNSTASNEKDNATVTSTVLIETTTEYLKNSTVSSLTSATVTEQSTLSESSTPTKIVEEITTKISELAEPASASTVANVTICKKGFVLNQKGGCDFKLQSASNALLKIIKLSQKLKRREHREEAGSE